LIGAPTSQEEARPRAAAFGLVATYIPQACGVGSMTDSSVSIMHDFPWDMLGGAALNQRGREETVSPATGRTAAGKGKMKLASQIGLELTTLRLTVAGDGLRPIAAICR
jgi:hypothetical protein